MRSPEILLRLMPAANYFSHGHTLVPDQKICNFKRAEIGIALNYLKEVKPVVQ